MCHECQWDNSSSRSQFVQVNHYRSKYGLQHGALAQIEQQDITGPKITSVQPFKQENQETRTTYESHQQTATTKNQIPDLGLVQINAAGLNVFIGISLHPYLKQ